ncbi:hypothetical protein F5Y00DRAFT_163898 [Daldinia vernicosa]|uniref:uncharacterized protein n=1 Tax=Daldinia vernicosa TaxID=114800 RepID=UPI002008814C|nr:uncharacterized protein F5Y00DRAFT_163898 [Daldinia vernicosa]KAI0845675.1 hypothetical protein F5Y00DRAFT_163898 [Daldinia vernicosa]
MDRQSTFHLFPYLPAELRHEIWRMAMADWYIVTFSKHSNNDRLRSLGWDPSTIGQVCQETKFLMQKTFLNVRWPPRSLGKQHQNIGCWINFGTAIVHFGPADVALDRIRYTGGEFALSRLAYAAITWTSWSDIVKCFQQFSLHYHSLHTVFIFASAEPIISQPRKIRNCDIIPMVNSITMGPPRLDAQPLDAFRISEDLRAWFRKPVRPPAVILLPL